MFEYLLKLWGLGEAHIIQSFSQSMSNQDRMIVIVDLQVAGAWIDLGLSQKLDFWKRLPWVCCGMAHWDADVRMRCAALALEAWRKADDAGFTVDDHHPKSVLFLAPAGQLRTHVEALARTGQVHPTLSLHLCRLKLIPTAERTIEQPHAIVNLKVGKRTVVSPYVSLASVCRRHSTSLNETHAFSGAWKLRTTP